MDLHAHSSNLGTFLFGNYSQVFFNQVEMMTYSKLLSMNCISFDYSECGFHEKLMYLKDRRDGTSREGSGRVAIGKMCNLIHSYTLEAHFIFANRYSEISPP